LLHAALLSANLRQSEVCTASAHRKTSHNKKKFPCIPRVQWLQKQPYKKSVSINVHLWLKNNPRQNFRVFRVFSGYKNNPIKKSVFICVHPWLKIGCGRVVHPKDGVDVVDGGYQDLILLAFLPLHGMP
jgi:hypothetical protein